MSTPIMRLFLAIVLLFVILIAWTSRWSVFEANALRENPLDKRPLFAGLQVKRGAITSADGAVLARSVRVRRKGGSIYEREYPTASLFGHPVGYANLLFGQLSGLERSRNDELTGTTSELNSIVDQLQGKRRAGNTVVTTLDEQAQRVATEQLAGQKGAIVALDPRSGAVKAMVSSPGYDPNDVRDPDALSALNRDTENAPLLDRVTQGAYPPGSTFKVVTAAAALDSGEYTPTSPLLDGDTPRIVSGVPLRNDDGVSRGPITLTTALTYSVNTAFAQLGERLGKRTMGDYMERFGFYRLPPLDYPDAQMIKSGERLDGRLIPVTSPAVDVGRMAIGQDKLAVTPLQMALVASAVANGGKLMEPHLTDKIVDPDGRTVDTVEPKQWSQPISSETAAELTQMMGNVVDEGTGTAVQLPGIDVAGKTGTAEKNPAENINQPWFIAFAPKDDPQIAIAVTVESTVGGFGGTVAAPIAREVLASLLSR